MIKQFFAAATIVTALASIQTEASFVETDWKNSGDKLATLDTNTGLEWLDLTQTANKSINMVKSQLDTVYTGWRLPTYEEIKSLAASLYPTKGAVSHSGSLQEERDTHRLFGVKVGTYTFGLYEKPGEINPFLFGVNTANRYVYFDHRYNFGMGWRSIYEGVYLVSDGGTTLSSINNPTLNIKNPNAPINQGGPAADVVSPAGLAAAGALLMFLGARRRKLRDE